ncbi:MAG: DUF2304 domain-containing protein [Phycisphaeraceae bacterium]
MTLTLILLAIGAMLLVLAVRSLRAQRLKERYALLFFSLGLPFFALAAWPDAVGYIAQALGIHYPTVLLLSVTTFFLLMIFKLLSLVSVQERKIATLAQLIGTLTAQQNAAKGPTTLPGPHFEQDQQ